ncbi:MAG TPA: SPOR domain-containing protein [Mucilaginibacter sp.]|nr:SPOR domain-containing protein [Mucilaginibacter sp.]
MDLAIYISELLGFKGEANVPGLGLFLQKRISAHYSEHEHKFYPPRHEISFSPEFSDDESLANYITSKKNISLASAKYFIDKYVTGLKQQASAQEIEIPGLGYLHYEYATLTFRPSDHAGSDPSLFDLPPVTVYKLGEQPVTPRKPPVQEPKQEVVKEPEKQAPVEETPAETPVAEEETADENEVPAEEAEQEEYVYEEEDNTRGRSRWIIFLLLIVIVLIGIPGLYMYKPSLFKRFFTKKTIVIVKPMPANPKDTDSVATAGSPADTMNKVVTQPAIDTFGVKRYEIQAGAFPTIKLANAQIKKYEKLGLNARIVGHTTGKYYKITLGTYFDETAARKKEDSILTATKLTKKEIYIQPYNPIKEK